MTLSAGDQVELLKEIALIRDLVEDTYKAITGDQSLGHRGLAERVERVEVGLAQETTERRDSVKRVHDRIDRIDKRWAVLVGAVFGAGLTGGGVGAAIVNYLS